MTGFDQVEATVIDEDLIKAAYEEEKESQKSGGETGEIKKESVSMAEIIAEATSLRLSFRNIFKIDNLQGFQNITTLYLDNNIIEEIVNLSHLVNLEWLDLSFNNIRAVTGLESLTKLKDLSLYNNSIDTISGKRLKFVLGFSFNYLVVW